MSEESLRRFLERLNTDANFRESVASDPRSAFGEFELSPAERIAFASDDEDALRRLAGADVAGFAAPGLGPAGGVWDPVSWLINCPHTQYCITSPECTYEKDCTMLCRQHVA